METFDPIAAISTPYGKGGVSLIRLSGLGALSLCDCFFIPKNKKKLSETEHGKAVYGDIVFEGKKIDDGIATVFYAPRSYTGDETVEITCHGGIILTQNVLSCALCFGFRQALAGEFTKRAFLNGKISLTQAESVIGLIDAENNEQLKLSSSIMSGVLSKEVDSISYEITELLASVYAYIDYPDEDLTDVSIDDLIIRTKSCYERLCKLCDSYKAGRAVNEGIKTAIVGKPNAGKSSLLNKLLGYDRAIVTDIAGTTRDTVEESVNIGRITLRLCDTAGIHKTDDKVEMLGIDRSIEKMKSSELIIAVFDGSLPLNDEDNELISILNSVCSKVICVVNKADVCKTSVDFPYDTFEISALTGEGIEELKNAISQMYIENEINYDVTPIIANSRQYASASSARDQLKNAINALENGFTQDIAGMDMELSLSKLKEIDGRGVNEEITDRIFSRFCVGK